MRGRHAFFVSIVQKQTFSGSALVYNEMTSQIYLFKTVPSRAIETISVSDETLGSSGYM